MREGRVRHSMTPLIDSVRTRGVPALLAVALAGGLLLNAQILEVRSGSWEPTGSMSVARSGAASVVLLDGRVLITGGSRPAGPLASTEVFNALGESVIGKGRCAWAISSFADSIP